MKTIRNSLNQLIDFETVEVKEGDTFLYITQLPGKGVFINIDKIDYFKNHVSMHAESWENFLYRLTYDKAYRANHVVNKRWYSVLPETPVALVFLTDRCTTSQKDTTSMSQGS